MKKKRQMIAGAVIVGIFVFLALLAPVIAPNEPDVTNLLLKNAKPSGQYPLGCDQMGRCELSRLLYGARYSLGLTIPLLSVLALFSLIVGSFVTYKGGIWCEIVRWICDVFMAFPLVVIAMALVTSFENPLICILVAIGISMTAWFLRMACSYAKTECAKEYIEAAKLSGAGSVRIVCCHIIPNIVTQFIVYFTTGIASAIISVSAFAFLGVGLVQGTAEWGAMLNEARNSLYTNSSLILYPGICLIICCAGFNLFGEGLRDYIGKETSYHDS